MAWECGGLRCDTVKAIRCDSQARRSLARVPDYFPLWRGAGRCTHTLRFPRVGLALFIALYALGVLIVFQRKITDPDPFQVSDDDDGGGGSGGQDTSG